MTSQSFEGIFILTELPKKKKDTYWHYSSCYCIMFFNRQLTIPNLEPATKTFTTLKVNSILLECDMFWAALLLMNEILPGKLQKQGFLNISLIITAELLEQNNGISFFTIFLLHFKKYIIFVWTIQHLLPVSWEYAIFECVYSVFSLSHHHPSLKSLSDMENYSMALWVTNQ